MTNGVINSWILSVSFIIGLTVNVFAVKTGKNARWNLLGAALILAGILFVSGREQEGFKEEQQHIIQEELSTRFHLTGVRIESLNEQTRTEGNTYRIESENGVYTATFQPNRTQGFELNEQQGEPLRGRRNAYEAVASIPEEKRMGSIHLEYQHPDLYTLKGENGNWTIQLNDSVVTHVLDEDGIVRYQYEHTPTEGEETHE